jgi:hypothetical protein
MKTLQLGEAFQQIRDRPSFNGAEANVIDAELCMQTPFDEIESAYDMQFYVYVRDQWLLEGDRTGVYIMMRLSSNPIIVTRPKRTEEEIPESQLPHTAVEMELNGHRFDPLDMVWVCTCGDHNDPDQYSCSECGGLNPFLGVLI